MDYPYTHFDAIVPYNAPVGTHGTLTLLELARSILLSSRDSEPELEASDIAQRIASKNTFLSLGQGERWEETLRDVLRRHYCFIARPSSKDRRRLRWSCDPTVQPMLKRSHSKKRALDSTTPSSSTVNPRSTTSPVVPPEDVSFADMPHEGISSASRVAGTDDVSEGDIPASLEIETTEVYELRRRWDGRVFYCQKCGPYTLRRQRWDGAVITKGLAKLVLLLRGDTIAGMPIKEVFGLEKQSTWPQTISIAAARDVINMAELPLPPDNIFADAYPALPDDAPPYISRDAVPVKCRYCGTTIGKHELRSHLLSLQGTCQLQHPLQLHRYLSLLQEVSDDFPHTFADSEGEEDDEEVSDKLARPVIGSTFTAWTDLETEKFFYALQRFSKFRCDAIAEHIGTKNEVEVAEIVDKFEEATTLLKAHNAFNNVSSPPAARQMSEAWLRMEEALAEDVTIWEEFVERTRRTPVEFRDVAQHSIADHHMHLHCTTCRRHRCDGKQPSCGRCLREGLTCQWPGPIVSAPEQPEQASILSQSLGQAYSDYRQPNSGQDFARAEFLEGLSWIHLLALRERVHIGALKPRLDLAWWKAASVVRREQEHTLMSSKKTPPLAKGRSWGLRTHVARGVVESANNHEPIALEEKEAILQYLKQTASGKGNQLPSVDTIAKMRNLPEVTAQRDRIVEAFAQDEAFAARRSQSSSRKLTRDWSGIPLSYVPDSVKEEAPQNKGIHEDFQQAQRQVKAAKLKPPDLGHAGELFNLRNLGLLLDLYRSGSDDTACFSKVALDMLYALVRKYTTRILALSINIAESRDAPYRMSQTPDPDSFLDCVKEAGRVIKAMNSTSRESSFPPVLKAYLRGGPTSAANERDLSVKRPTVSSSSASTSEIVKRTIFDLEPLNAYALGTWEGDVDFDDEVDGDMDPNSSSGSEHGGSSEDEANATARDREAKLAEDDTLEDHLYEQSLWEGLNSGGGPTLDEMASDGPDSGSGHITSAAIDLDSESGTDSGADVSGDDYASSSDDESEGESDAAGIMERPSKRQRTSKIQRVSQAPWAGPVYSTARPKRIYRTQEFITTSDEEEDDE